MILSKLRVATRHLHARVEQRLALEERLRSKDSYARLLSKFYGFYLPLEARLSRVSSSMYSQLDVSQRMKTPWIRRDLLALGWSEDAFETIPSCKNLPTLSELSQAFGCLYVLEGSTLGGQLIRRMVHDRLGLGAETGCAFFIGYGERTGEMWQRFCGLLASFADSPEAVDTHITGAAVATFESFEEWFSI